MKIITKRIILVLLAVGWFKPAYCGDEVVCNRLRGAQIAHNATIDVEASPFD